MPPGRSPLAELFAALDGAFQRLGLRWYLFGAQAALLHGAARLSDVDVTVDAADIAIADLLRELEAAGFAARVADPADFAARTSVVPLTHAPTSIPVDAVLAGPGLEALFLARAETRDIEGVHVPVACAADVVTMKILAGRPKDLDDATAILAAGGDRLDLTSVRETLAMLEEALAQSDLLPRLEAMLARVRADAS